MSTSQNILKAQQIHQIMLDHWRVNLALRDGFQTLLKPQVTIYTKAGKKFRLDCDLLHAMNSGIEPYISFLVPIGTSKQPVTFKIADLDCVECADPELVAAAKQYNEKMEQDRKEADMLRCADIFGGDELQRVPRITR